MKYTIYGLIIIGISAWAVSFVFMQNNATRETVKHLPFEIIKKVISAVIILVIFVLIVICLYLFFHQLRSILF